VSHGIQIRVFGPAVAAADVQDAGFAVSAESAKQLTDLFVEHLSKTRNGPVQMLVDAPDMPPSVVNVFRYYGAAAVVHVLRAPPSGDVPAMTGIVAILPGVDKDADDAAIDEIEKLRDKSGKPLPLPPTVYESLRADVRPLIGMLLFHEEAVKDVSLRVLGICLAKAFFTSLRNAQGKQKAPGDSSPGA
jgi:hypothetical protein